MVVPEILVSSCASESTKSRDLDFCGEAWRTGDSSITAPRVVPGEECQSVRDSAVRSPDRAL